MSRQRVAEVYVSYGENVLENFMDRLTGRNGVSALGLAVKERLREWAVNRYGADAKPRISWSWKLGCTCPCSPGYSITIDGYHDDMYANKQWDDGGRLRHTKRGPATVWVTVGKAEQVGENSELLRILGEDCLFTSRDIKV